MTDALRAGGEIGCSLSSICAACAGAAIPPSSVGAFCRIIERPAGPEATAAPAGEEVEVEVGVEVEVDVARACVVIDGCVEVGGFAAASTAAFDSRYATAARMIACESGSGRVSLIVRCGGTFRGGVATPRGCDAGAGSTRGCDADGFGTSIRGAEAGADGGGAGTCAVCAGFGVDEIAPGIFIVLRCCGGCSGGGVAPAGGGIEPGMSTMIVGSASFGRRPGCGACGGGGGLGAT